MLLRVVYDKRDQERYFSELLDIYIQSFQSEIGKVDDDMKTFAMAEYSKDLRIALSDLLFACKNYVYEHEKEWRILAIFPVADDEHRSAVKYRTGPLGMVPYIEYALHAPAGVKHNRLSMSEVVQGPRSEPELCANALRGFLSPHGFAMTDVRISDVPLRY